MPLVALRILVVDDFEPLRYLVSLQLRRLGAEVIEAATGQEALVKLETEQLDLAVLDVNLPDMMGMELAARMRSDARTASLPVIYTSASERPEQLDAAAVFFQEPIERADLVDAIRALVGR